MSVVIYNVIISSLLVLLTFKDFSEPKKQDEVKRITATLLSEFGEKTDFPRRFIFDSVDLNGDKINEFLVGLMGPDFCGTGGCTMLVINSEMQIISKMTLVEYPVYLGSDSPNDKTNGYKNLYLRTGKVGFVKMAWSGKSYPSNPSLQPLVSDSFGERGKKFLNAEEAQGIEF